MAAFGENCFPRRFGGGIRPHTLETRAVARSFQRDGFKVSEGTARAGEAFAYGRAVAVVWACNERLRGSEQPSRMLETLPTWEEILRTRPESGDSDNARRNVVAAKLRALAGQATSEDIEDVCTVLMGSAFEGLARVDPADVYSYWPGMNPGPPGYEWTSNRLTLGILVRQGTRSDAVWDRLIQQLGSLLQTLLPGWEVFEIGTDDGGFVCDVGLPGETFL
jgi:hypothetical protein